MRYMLLIYSDEQAWETMTADDRQAIHQDYATFTQHIIDSGEHLAGDALQSVESATTVRVRGGKTAATDGPFAETKEVLGGYYLVDCKDLDRAIELSAMIPDAKIASVEVRPIQELPDMPSA
jgi:hypothetical protein